MRKNFIFILLTAVLVALTAMPALAAKRDATPEQTEALFAKQAPLSQNDIDIFIENYAAFKSLSDNASFNRLADETGLSSIRVGYIKTKIEFGYIIVQRPDYKEHLENQSDMPRSLIPSDAEISLIKRNEKKLDRIFK